jgi:hypothetical protein
MQALKIWNKDHGQWCIPRKDTDEYKEVIKIMGLKPIVKTPVKKTPVKHVVKTQEPKETPKPKEISIHGLNRIEQIIFDSGKKSGMSDNEILQTIETRRLFRNTLMGKKRAK